MKNFKSKLTKEKFKKWLNAHPESWHPLDYERFHDFINELFLNKDSISGIELKEAIHELKKWENEKSIDDFIEKTQKIINELQLFYGYLKRKGLENQQP